MAEIIKANYGHEIVEPINGTDFSLEELRDIVGGHIEVLTDLTGENYMVLNEEGKIEGLPYNVFATMIARKHFGIGNDVIVGDVLICKVNQIL